MKLCVSDVAAFIVWASLFAMPFALGANSPQGPPPPISQSSATASLGKDTLNEDLQRLTNRVVQLELETAKASKPSQDSAVVTAIIVGSATLVAALIAGGLTLLGQRFMATREERRAILTAERAMELAREEAIFQHAEKILEFRIKQMELFYAPMFALLQQSNGLYSKMLYQLADDEPNRYKLLSTPDPEGYTLHVLAKDGSWKGFRLLDQLPAVRANPKAFALAGSILQIGERMTKIISEHAGLASKDLMDLLGVYLAHYAILSTIYERGETIPYEPGWHKVGYYPHELNEKITTGYRELSQFLDEYAQKSKRMLEALPVKKDSD